MANIASGLVSAAEAEVGLTERRVTLLKLRVGVLKSKEEAERKETYLNGLANTHKAISHMEDELNKAKQELAFKELRWAE